MNVLSLFDGISCGQLALERAGIEVDKYFASEVDRFAIQITNKHYPNTIQLGDINKWKTWTLPKINLILAGFPCQAWSVAGKQQGDQDPRGALFWIMLDVYKHIKAINPQVKFLFENVRMKKEFLNYINTAIGCNPIVINSALVSAQNRIRCYWTNIPNVGQPSDKGIQLTDIIQNGVVDKSKSYSLDANYFKGGNLKSYLEKHRRQLVFNYSSSGMRNGIIASRFSSPQKSCTMTASLVNCRSFTGVIASDELSWRKLTPIECERLQTLPDNYTGGVSDTQRYKAIGNGWTVDVIAHILSYLE